MKTNLANHTISRPKNRREVRRKRYRTKHIIDLVQEVLKTDSDDTKEFARGFERNLRGLRELFDFVDYHFVYVEDPPGSQVVQTPAHLWESKTGDCKSYTVFISSVLQNLGIPHLIRYAAYGTKHFVHVYVVALLNGREVPMDVVWKKQEGGRFNAEKGYTKKKDFRVEGLIKLGNTAQTSISEEAIIGRIQATLNHLEAVEREIPDLVHRGKDVTTMSKGELNRFILAERYEIYADQETNGGKRGQYADAAAAMRNNDMARVAGLRNDPFGQMVQRQLAATNQQLEPAFQPITVRIPNPVPPQLRGLFRKVGNFIRKVKDKVVGVFKKFTNWLFKGAAQAMGPFFIFSLLRNKNKVKSPKIRARIKAQEKQIGFIQRVGKYDEKQLRGLLENGVKKHTGKSSSDIAREGGVPAIGAISAVIAAVVKAIGVVINVINKIAGIFKKRGSDAGPIDKSTMSDVTLFEEEERLQRERYGAAGGGGSGNAGLLAAGVAALAVFAL